MSWALKDAPVPDPVAHLILIGLADHAADDGTGARPSRATLADYAHVTARTVGTKLKMLEDSGVIRRGDQQQVAHLRSDRRPVVWDLNLLAIRSDDPNGGKIFPVVDSETDYGMHPASPRAEDFEENGGNEASPRSPDEGNGASPRNLHEGNPASPREPDGGKTVSYRTVPLTTKPSYVGVSSREEGDEEASPSADGTTTSVTGNPIEGRDMLRSSDLRPHTPPGAWSPSAAAWEEARSACKLLNLQLHLARYRVVKKEKNQPPSNGEWLRWAIQDETNLQAEERKAAIASRQTRPWYDVAD